MSDEVIRDTPPLLGIETFLERNERTGSGSLGGVALRVRGPQQNKNMAGRR